MNYHLPTQTYFRQNLHFEQQICRQRAISPLDDAKVWRKVRNLVSVLCPVLFTVSMFLASISNNLDKSIQTVEEARHELTEKQIDLRAKRDQVYSPDNVLLLASARLSLDIPDEERITVYK